jgi:hypothetical protein
MGKRKCLFKKCGVEFTPSKNKQVYCSTKCRTYAYRESLNKIEKVDLVEKFKIHDLGDGVTVKEKATNVLGGGNTFKNSKAGLLIPKPDKHPLWKQGDPKEGSMAFYKKYGVATYEELEKKQKNEE